MDVINLNLDVIAQSDIANFLSDLCKEMKFHNDVQCSNTQSVGARQNGAISTPWGIPSQVHMKDFNFAPILWIKRGSSSSWWTNQYFVRKWEAHLQVVMAM